MSTSIKSYAIVEFLDSSPTTVQAVPCQWLLLEGGDLFSFWPPPKCDIQKLIKSYVQAKSTWEKFMVRQLGKADSYNEALKKAKAAELTSDLSASETSDLRTRHDRCRVVETDQDEEHVGLAKSTSKKHPQSAVLRHDSTGNTSGLCATAPPVPKGLELNALSWKNGAADPLQRDSGEGAGASHPNSSQVVLVSGKQVTAMSSPAVGTSVGSMPSFSYRSPAVFVESVQNQVGIRRTPVSVRPSPSSAGYPLSDSSGRCMVDSPALQLMVKHMAELKEQVFFNTQLLQSLARRQRSSEKIGQLPENCPLPLDSLDSVNAIEQQLKSKQCYDQLVSYLALIGGATTKEFVSRTMSAMFEPIFSRQFVWAGRLTEKKAFKKLELKNVLLDALRKNPLTSKATTAEMEFEVKKWLRGSEDRNGGRVERANKKREEALTKKRSSGRRSREHSSVRRSRERSSGRRSREHSSVRRSREHSSVRRSRERSSGRRSCDHSSDRQSGECSSSSRSSDESSLSL